MKIVTKFMAVVAYVAIAVGLQVLVMINGWGVTPRSWCIGATA